MVLGKFKFEVSDTFAFCFVLASVIGEFLFELFVVLPVTERGIVPPYIHVLLGTYVFMNILGNFSMTIINDPSTRKIILPSVLKTNWYFCSACEANSPPRAFHCSKCKICVLKRDHHCAYARCCIGLKNFRYFLIFLFYLSIGAAYATSFNIYFIWDVLGGFSMYTLAIHIVPFIFFILGYLTIRQFLCTFMSVLSICGVLFVSNLFVFHFRHMIRNQTVFEKNYGVHKYNLGWKNNLVESLGKNWHLVWLFPSVKSPLPSDGLSFRTNHTEEPILLNNITQENLRLRHGAFVS